MSCKCCRTFLDLFLTITFHNVKRATASVVSHVYMLDVSVTYTVLHKKFITYVPIHCHQMLFVRYVSITVSMGSSWMLHEFYYENCILLQYRVLGVSQVTRQQAHAT